MKQNLSGKKSNPFIGFIETRTAYLLSALLLMLMLVLFRQFIFGDKLFLFTDIGSDTLKFSWPSYFHYSTYLRQYGLPKWTFAQGLGQNVFPAYLGDVPSWLLYLVQPTSIPGMLIYVQLIKIFGAGIFFFLFLKETGTSAYGSILGAMLYAFSGFMIIGSTWYIFTTEGLYLAAWLYGAVLVRKGNLLIFPLAVAVVAAYNPVLLLPFSLLVLAYLLCSNFVAGVGLIRSTKTLVPGIGKLILLGSLGLLVASFFFFGAVNQIFESPRGSGGVSVANQLISEHVFVIQSPLYYQTFLLRLLGNDMAGFGGTNRTDYLGWWNYLESPMQYCGFISLLLLPQLFVLGAKKLRIAALVCLLVALLPVIFPFFRYAFWLFQGTYFRTFSLLFGVLQIILSVRSLDAIITSRKINLPLLLTTLALLLLMLFSFSITNQSQRWIAAFFLIIESTWLIMIPMTRLPGTALIFLSLTVFIELGAMNWSTINYRQTIKKGGLEDLTGYHDHTTEAVKFVQTLDSGFYRLSKGVDFSAQKDDPRICNHGLLQGYYGLASYHPFNQKYYVRFLQKMNLIPPDNEWATRMVSGLGPSSLLADIVSTKFLIFPGEGNDPYPHYHLLADRNDVKIYRNNLFLPLGFTYRKFLSESEASQVAGKDTLLLKAFIADDQLDKKELAGLQKYSKTDSEITSPVDSLEADLKRDTLHITSFSPNHIAGKIQSSGNEFLFFSIPYDKGWSANIDGKPVKPVLANYGFFGFTLTKGVHDVQLDFEPAFYKAGMALSVLGLITYLIMLVINLYRRPVQQ